MNVAAAIAEMPRSRRRSSRFPGLIGAELLKLRQRRGVVLASLGLTVAPMLIAYTVLVALHAANPAKHGPAGGQENFVNTMELLRNLVVVAAILIGVTIGTGDLRAGVFRELVVTGRSRLALFAARIPAGPMLILPLLGTAFATSAVASIALAGTSAAPSVSLLVHTVGWVGLIALSSYMLALGVSAVVGSASTSIGVLLGLQLIVTPLLLGINGLGGLRELLPGAAPLALAPGQFEVPGASLSMSTAAALAAIALWTTAPLAVGAWRTQTRDA